jgi:hypothetical protein
MKLTKTLTIASQTYDLVNDEAVLEVNSAGRATFTIDTNLEEIQPFTPVALDIGYTQHEHLSRFFLGYVETVNPRDRRQSVLFCRELSGVLAKPSPVSLRHPTMRDVLTAIHEKNGLNFAVPDDEYATFKIPHFQNIGNGYHAIEHIGKAFKIADYFWQQQADGTVFAGSWADSPWPDREAELPDDWFTDQYAKSAQIPALPSLRPGAILNGQRVKQVSLTGNFMTVEWV